MSLIQFLHILMARRMILLVCFVTSVVVAGAVASFLPPRYTAKTRVLMDIIKPDPVTGLMVSGRDPRAFIRTQIELIQDYRVATDVVDRLGWPNNPAVIASWQAETGGVGDIRRWGAERIIAGTTATTIANANILEISYEAPSPEAARAIATLLREAYIDANLRFTVDSAGRTAEWYREQTDRALAALTAAERAKTRFEQQNQIVMTGEGEAETAKLTSLQGSLLAARGAQTTQQFAAAQQGSTSPVVDQLKIQLAQITDQIQQAAGTLGVEHPSYKALVARKNLLERQLSTESASARSAGASSSNVSRQSLASLEAEYNAQRAKVLSMKDTLNELTQLQREVDLRREQYQSAATKAAELRLQSSVSESGLVVLGDAIGSNTPSFPNWPQVWGLSAGFGLALGVALSLLVELLGRRVRGPEDLGFAAKVPVLAVIADAPRSALRQMVREWLTRRGMAGGTMKPAE
ncbi:Wzz/FepE/Etk N-terminal domain-containing protein [Polymorphobacter sp.]|uniref:Wzz/FepE/Etk N-terminal domain-containing protein n=1 Tax=Polymorphobacter sp. TaxID=1909290 RepID=UPI003F72140B